jgi:hypothetical protein
MRALVKTSGTAIVAGTDHTPGALIRQGIADLMIAFQAGSQRSEGDCARRFQLYREELSHFHPAVAERTLRWLRRHNPRNPFPPTPMDVYEACKQTARSWRADVLEHFFPVGPYRRGTTFEGSPPPLEAGCVVPPDLVIEILREELAKGSCDHELRFMSYEFFAALPEEVFELDHRDRMLAQRAHDAERKAAAERECEYLDKLPHDLRHARGEAKSEFIHARRSLTEDDLITRARELLAEKAVRVANRRKERRHA